MTTDPTSDLAGRDATIQLLQATGRAVEEGALSPTNRVLIALVLRPESTSNLVRLTGLSRRDVSEALCTGTEAQRVHRYRLRKPKRRSQVRPPKKPGAVGGDLLLHRLTPPELESAEGLAHCVSCFLPDGSPWRLHPPLTTSYAGVILLGRGVLKHRQDRALLALDEPADGIATFEARSGIRGSTSSRLRRRLSEDRLLSPDTNGHLGLTSQGRARVEQIVADGQELLGLLDPPPQPIMLRDALAKPGPDPDLVLRVPNLHHADFDAVRDGRMVPPEEYAAWCAAADANIAELRGLKGAIHAGDVLRKAFRTPAAIANNIAPRSQ